MMSVANGTRAGPAGARGSIGVAKRPEYLCGRFAPQIGGVRRAAASVALVHEAADLEGRPGVRVCPANRSSSPAPRPSSTRTSAGPSTRSGDGAWSVYSPVSPGRIQRPPARHAISTGKPGSANHVPRNGAADAGIGSFAGPGRGATSATGREPPSSRPIVSAASCPAAPRLGHRFDSAITDTRLGAWNAR